MRPVLRPRGGRRPAIAEPRVEVGVVARVVFRLHRRRIVPPARRRGRRGLGRRAEIGLQRRRGCVSTMISLLGGVVSRGHTLTVANLGTMGLYRFWLVVLPADSCARRGWMPDEAGADDDDGAAEPPDEDCDIVSLASCRRGGEGTDQVRVLGLFGQRHDALPSLGHLLHQIRVETLGGRRCRWRSRSSSRRGWSTGSGSGDGGSRGSLHGRKLCCDLGPLPGNLVCRLSTRSTISCRLSGRGREREEGELTAVPGF